MDWKKIWGGIVEHFLTKLIALLALTILTAFSTTKLTSQGGEKDDTRRLSERVTRIMYYMEEILPDSSKASAERKMAADKEKWDLP